MRGTAASSVAFLGLLLVTLQAQAPATSYTVVTREGRRPLATTPLNGLDFVALEDVASLFQATLNDEASAGGVTLTYRGRTIVASANQSTVSANGRVVSLPSPVVRSGRRWLVPVEFLQSAFGAIYDQRIVVRRPSRLVLIGDVRVPRVAARIDAPGPPTRATIEVTPGAPVTAATEATRIVVRVDADAIDPVLPPAAGGLIAQIRPGDQPGTVIVVLAPGAGPARTVTQAGDATTRVTIEVPAATTQGAPPPGIAAPVPGTAPVPAPADLPPAVSVETLLARRPVLQTVVIDPGHGGEARGVRGASGLEEKRVSLDVAQRLKGLLESRLGLRVILTRESDTAVPADVRIAAANNNKADLFISLHLNAAPSPAVAGAEIYYLWLDREGKAVRDKAARTAVAMPVLGGGARTIDIIPWDLAQARHVEDSMALAAVVASTLEGRTKMGPTPVRAAPLRLLEGLNMPAVMVEMAYLTNPAQEKLFATEAHRNIVAQALFDGIVQFRMQLEERQSP